MGDERAAKRPAAEGDAIRYFATEESMPSIEETVRQIIVERMMLPIPPQELPLEAPLFAPASAGGMGSSSDRILASISLCSGLSGSIAR